MGRTHFLGWDGEALAAMGRTEEGLRRLDEALASVEDTGERLYEAELHRLKGAVLLTKSIPEASEAEACFRRSLDIARDQGGRLWELRAAVSLARLWHERGKTAQALDLLAPIHGGFIEGQDTADVQAAKALIDKLS